MTANGSVTATAWIATAHGDPTKVLELGEVEVPAPGPNEVRVAVEAFCLNLNDIDIIRGRYNTLMLDPPFVPGMESVGTVEGAGPGAEHLLGQRIVGIPTVAHGGYATYALVDAATALELPGDMPAADGAALHYPFHLGWFALHERARLQPLADDRAAPVALRRLPGLAIALEADDLRVVGTGSRRGQRGDEPDRGQPGAAPDAAAQRRRNTALPCGVEGPPASN